MTRESQITCMHCGRIIERCTEIHDPSFACRGWVHQAWPRHLNHGCTRGRLPPPHLMTRVSGNDDAGTYTQTGARLAARLAEALTWADRPVRDVLDWGCGPGRVTVHLARDHPELALCGCDIDTEAIAWCRENIPGQFAVSPLYPPLPYPDGSFDAVLAMSVMTHLPRRTQRRWLQDLARVLRPGGVLLASVHGQAAAAAFRVSDLAGIRDHYLNTDLAGIVPDGYYRDVLQDEAYTRNAWSDWFEIATWYEAHLELHDLVVCRKSS